MNDIIKLLNIEDSDLNIMAVRIEGNIKYIELEKKLKPQFCPSCFERMHSKGICLRTVNHSMLQDGFIVKLIIHQRRWVCKNPECRCTLNDSFSFVQERKRVTNLLPFMMIEQLRDINKSVAMVARQYHVSDTYLHDTFMRYVDMKSLPLPEVLSVDEVFLDIHPKAQYCLVLMDFKTRQIIDILANRWKSTVDNYFYSIPFEERKKVKFIISDMYELYLEFPDLYFPNATVIIDSFHVIAFLNQRLNQYVLSVKRRYQKRDRELLKTKNHDNNTDYTTSKKSREIDILNHYKWFLLADHDEIDFNPNTHYNKYLHAYVNTYQLEQEFLKLVQNFLSLQKLKQKYLRFNKSKFDSIKDTSEMLNNLMNDYYQSNQSIFIEFANLLNVHQDRIIASFTWVQIEDEKFQQKNNLIARLSNGPMESFNRIPKDTKRISRGYLNFDVARNRILFATRRNPAIRATPKSDDEIHSYKGKERGSYNKN